jgi:hypothetical protein
MRRRIFSVLALTVLAAATNLVSTVSAGSLAQKQRVMLVQKQRAGAPTGTFDFYALSPGPLKLDSGTYTYTVVEKPPVIVNGQGMAVYVMVATLTGRRGTFVLRWRMEFVGAGDGHTVGTGTWSLVRGTGAYTGASGGGRVAAVAVTPRGFTSSQYEGFVRVLT